MLKGRCLFFLDVTCDQGVRICSYANHTGVTNSAENLSISSDNIYFGPMVQMVPNNGTKIKGSLDKYSYKNQGRFLSEHARM